MSTIGRSELNDIETSVAPLTDLQANAEILARKVFTRLPSYQSGVVTTLISAPTSGTWVIGDHWTDALGGEWYCTVAGTPGTWRQNRPAIYAGEPGSGTIATGYLIWDVADSFKLKRHAGSYVWQDINSSLVFDTSNYWTDVVAADGGRTLAGFGTDADLTLDFQGATDGDLIVLGPSGITHLQLDNSARQLNSYGSVRIQFGGGALGPSMVIGADANAYTITDATIKQSRLTCPHYTNAEEEVMTMFTSCTSTINQINFGGGSSLQNSATYINFWNGATNTTVTGTIAMTINAEKVGIGISAGAPSGQLHVDQNSATGAIPVLFLDQADLSEEFIEFNSTVGAGNPIDTAAIGTYYGKIRVMVTGVGYKYIPLHNT